MTQFCCCGGWFWPLWNWNDFLNSTVPELHHPGWLGLDSLNLKSRLTGICKVTHLQSTKVNVFKMLRWHPSFILPLPTTLSHFYGYFNFFSLWNDRKYVWANHFQHLLAFQYGGALTGGEAVLSLGWAPVTPPSSLAARPGQLSSALSN